MSRMQAVVFDMDGLLFDTEALCLRAFVKAAEEMGIPGMDQTFLGFVGRSRKDNEEFFYSVYGRRVEYEVFRKRVDFWVQREYEERGLEIKPGAKEILEGVGKLGLRRALASSTKKEGVLRNLEMSGFLDYFEVIITGDMVERSKPDPEIYRRACEGLSVEPSKAFALEDSPFGIRAAYTAGMKPIMVPDLIPADDEMREKSIFVVSDLMEAYERIQKLMGEREV